jgi:hypothetical protein
LLITDTTQMEYERLPVSSRGMRTSRKLLREGEALPGMGYYALIAKFHEGAEVFTAPRHRHGFQQIRVGLSGFMDFGPGLECEAGEVGYFPAGAYYGPERIEGAEQLLIQWSREWVFRSQNKAAMEELSRSGRWEHGLYYYLDESGEEREVDGPQAVWEHVYNRPQVIQKARYKSPIMMAPDAYDWVAGEGLSSKSLGRFTEDDVRVDMVRWDETGPAQTLEVDRTSLVWVLKGRVRVDWPAWPSSAEPAATEPCGPQTAIWSDLGEVHELVGDAGAEVLVIGFPVERPRSSFSA